MDESTKKIVNLHVVTYGRFPASIESFPSSDGAAMLHKVIWVHGQPTIINGVSILNGSWAAVKVNGEPPYFIGV